MPLGISSTINSISTIGGSLNICSLQKNKLQVDAASCNIRD
jgi:hypothetical protein